MDVERYRSETPGCSHRIHLNNAGAGLMPAPVIDTITSYLELESTLGGYEAQHQQQDVIASAYESVAKLIGAHANNVAFTENATASYMQALSAIPFRPDDTILTTRNDYASNQIQFLSLQKRFGIQVIHAPDDASGGVDISAMAQLMDQHSPRLVCVTHVPTNSGLRQDVNAVGVACRERDLVYLVDACQSIGQLPIDVADIQCDFLSATARKFLRGPRGSGVLYVSDRILQQGLEPLFIDMRGASWTDVGSYRPIDSAKRFENWEFPWCLVLGTGIAADYAMAVGPDNIQQRVSGLVKRLRHGLSAVSGATVLGSNEENCGIVTASFAKHDPYELVTDLRRLEMNVSAQGREYAVLDYARKNVDAALRISPHYYNTEKEIDDVVAVLAAVSTGEKKRPR